jgi:hypothetical protein
MAQVAESRSGEKHAFVKGVHGIRYQVKDVARAVAFYTQRLGFIAELKKAGVRFRNEMETGPGGRQIQIEDPDGNPVELFEPAR